MKAWMNKLGGVLLASLLTVMLNGKAYANDEVPSEPPATEISEPAAAPVSEPAAPVEAPVASESAPVAAPVAESQVASPVVEVAPETSAAAPTVTESAPEAPAAAAESVSEPVADAVTEAPEAVETESPAAAADAVPAVEVTGSTDGIPEAGAVSLTENTPAPETETPSPAENVTEPLMLKTVMPAPVATVAAPAASEEPGALEAVVPLRKTAAVSLNAVTASDSVSAAEDPAEPAALPDLATALRTAPLAKSSESAGAEAPAQILSRLDDGTYVMVNYQDSSAAISTDNPVLTVLAAGLNRIASLSSGGSINIGGTGILLVDSLQYGSGGSLNLMPNSELYGSDVTEAGSVAVFCKQEGTEKDYVFVNGTVPGRLDEAYTVEGCNLILPSGASLILSSIGQATDRETGEVIYYSGTVSGDVTDSSKYDYADETAASLTIGEGASLIVDAGAMVESVSTPKLSLDTAYSLPIVPSLKVTDNGNLTVNGSLSSGFLDIGADASLKGNGDVSAERMEIRSPSCLNGGGVTLHSHDCTIYGSGTIDTLKLSDSEVFLNSGEGSVTVNNVVSSSASGSQSVLVTGNSMTLKNISITGNLQLLTSYGYGQSSAVSTLQGPVSGGGTLRLGSGIYQLLSGFSCSSLNTNYHVIVYDYTSYFGSDTLLTAPLLVNSAALTGNMPPQVPQTVEGESVYCYEVPMIKVSASQNDSGNAGVWISVDEVKSLDPLLIPVGETGSYLAAFHQARINENKGKDPGLLYELQYFEDGSFRTVFITDPEGYSFSGENLYLIRVSNIMKCPGGQGGATTTSTQTAFTGSGILGGAGAGSATITIGGQTYDLSGASPVDLHPTGDSSSDPTPDPVPLVATVEETPNAPLIWAEVSPAASTDAASPAEAQYVVLALEGEKTLEELGGKATISMNYTLPADYAGKPLYVVFRNEDGTLTAIRATYSNITGLLRFITDRLGTFVVVGFDFDGKEFSEEFYAALAQLDVLKDLAFAEYSPV